MATIQPKLIPDMERIVEFDFVRATEVLARKACPGGGTAGGLVKNTMRLRAARVEGQL